MTEPTVYAEQGIPFFWRIDDGLRLQAYRLDPGTGSHVLDVELGPGERTVRRPVSLDMAEFVMPHKRG